MSYCGLWENYLVQHVADDSIINNLSDQSSELPKPFRRFGLDSQFIESFPDRDSLRKVPGFELSSIPDCPGNCFRANDTALFRPTVCQWFREQFPDLALTNLTVRAYAKPEEIPH